MLWSEVRILESPTLYAVKGGWAAQGRGWAVHALTREEALRKFEEAQKEHAEINRRPLPQPVTLMAQL